VNTYLVQVTQSDTTYGADIAELFFRRTFRIGKSTIAPRVDIFNATSEATVTARITQLVPTYERISGIQRGRLIKLGLNLEF
jgi:hypothetical protein